MTKLNKIMFLLVGLISFILGFIGIFLPILPTTPLFLLTSFCLFKYSDRLYEKFMQTKLYEKYVKSFKEQGGMTLKVKLCVVIPVSILLLFIFITIDNKLIKTIIIILWLVKVITFIKIKTVKFENKF